MPLHCICLQETREGYVLEAPPEGVDRRTAAEKRYDETQAKREAETSKKMALKSHRERVNEFNTYLQNLSEHHDIPRRGARLASALAPLPPRMPHVMCHLLCTESHLHVNLQL